MAAVVETVERDGKSVLVYDNGMEKDATTGKLMRPPTAALIRTTEQANDYLRRRQELKRERILAGAARTLERGEWDKATDLDVAEAIGEAVMMKALNPDNAKQVDAARFILTESGLSEAQQQAGTVNNTVNMIALPDDILHALNELRSRLNVALDTDSAISASNKVRIDERVIDVDPTQDGGA
jgi:hypothetical protein